MNKEDFQIRARFRRACRRAGIGDGVTLLVAVSGGCDSVSLLRLCADEAAARRWRIVVGHLDHGLREGSADDALWVRELARRLGLPSIGLKARPGVWEHRPGASLEARARRLRRAALRRMARRTRARWIVLGHTRDDQAETVLMNLFRGTGIRGLTGMPLSSPPFFRPLLDVERRQLEAFASRRKLAWREDPTNRDPRFLRNRIRHRLIPVLRDEVHPGVTKVLARSADAIQPVRRYLEAQVSEAWKALDPRLEAGTIHLDRCRLATYDEPVVEGVLRRAYQRLRGSARDLHRTQVAALARAALEPRPRDFHLPTGVRAHVDRSEVRLESHRMETG